MTSLSEVAKGQSRKYVLKIFAGIFFFMCLFLLASHQLISKTTKTGVAQNYGQVNQLKIKGAKADCEDCDISTLIDGIFPNRNCIADHKWISGSAIFHIPWALVTSVRIRLGDSDYGRPPSQRGTLVELCVGESNCRICGETPYSGQLGSTREALYTAKEEVFHCENRTLEGAEFEVNQVKVTQFFMAAFLAPCEVEIFGRVAVNEAVRGIEIYSVSGEEAFNGDLSTLQFSQKHVVSNTIDGNFSTDPFYCFISQQGVNGWATFSFEWSMVTHVKLLNAEKGSTIEGLSVFVCQFPPTNRGCRPCGFASSTQEENWTVVYCTGGMVEGNSLEIIHPYDNLKLCEVQIFGKQLALGLGVVNKVPIKVSFVHIPMGGSPVSVEGEPVAYSWHPVTQSCRMAPNHPAYVYHVLFDEVIVRYVQLTNCVHEGCEKLEGAKISVCLHNAKNCTTCDSVGTAPRGERVTVLCPEKPKGKFLQVGHMLGDVKYCNIQVFGELPGVYDNTDSDNDVPTSTEIYFTDVWLGTSTEQTFFRSFVGK